MKGLRIGLLVAGLAITVQAEAVTRWDAGISIGPEGIRGFHLSVSDYYKVPEPEVVVCKKKRIADEELPVVFFLAQQARCAPAAIVDLRLAGKSWMDIIVRYQIKTDIFQVPVTKVHGPPYGRAYGYWRKHGGAPPQGRFVLKDSEVVDLVNLRFLSDYHGCAPDEVMERRAKGENFIRIDADLKQKHGKSKDKDKGKDKGKGKGK